MGRMEKVNQLMKREISNIIQQEMEDPRFTFVTITQVKVSPDLRQARIGFSFLGDDRQLKNVAEGLSRVSGYIRKLIGQRIRLRYTPKLEFVYDQSIAYSAQINQALQEIKKEGIDESKEDFKGPCQA